MNLAIKAMCFSTCRSSIPATRTPLSFIENMDELVAWLRSEGIWISEGPISLGDGRRLTCFIRDPDLNVVEFNEILK